MIGGDSFLSLSTIGWFVGIGLSSVVVAAWYFQDVRRPRRLGPRVPLTRSGRRICSTFRRCRKCRATS